MLFDKLPSTNCQKLRGVETKMTNVFMKRTLIARQEKESPFLVHLNFPSPCSSPSSSSCFPATRKLLNWHHKGNISLPSHNANKTKKKRILGKLLQSGWQFSDGNLRIPNRFASRNVVSKLLLKATSSHLQRFFI